MGFRTVKSDLKGFVYDIGDFFYRLASRQRDLPPWSLRQFVGGARGFRSVGEWMVGDFKKRGLLGGGTRVLDIGCGCGRIAHALATDSEIRALNINYTGMDIDRHCIRWCARHITPRNPAFVFEYMDLFNPAYNPKGRMRAAEYVFPLSDASFDLIILTSVFTHLREADARQYLREIARLLSPQGAAYASFFTYTTRSEAVDGVARRANRFPCYHDTIAWENEKCPEDAVAYREDFLRGMFVDYGLIDRQPPQYGLQDVFVVGRSGK